MVRVGKFFAYFAFFMLVLYATFPKVNLFYKAQELLGAYKVEIIAHKLNEKLFSLQLEDFSVVMEGVQTAHVKKADIMLLGFYNSIDIQNIVLSGIVKNFAPPKVASAHIEYSILAPLKVTGNVVGDFGEVELSYLLKEKKLVLQLHPSKLMLTRYASTLQAFKKLKNGVYFYETSL